MAPSPPQEERTTPCPQGNRPPAKAASSLPAAKNVTDPQVPSCVMITAAPTMTQNASSPDRVACRLEDLPERIATRINISPVTGCWLWTGPLDKGGYGKLGSRNSHRVIWEILVGAVPPKLVLDHREDLGCTLDDGQPDKSCCWQAHLLAVTNQVNCTRNGVQGVAAVNATKTRCDHGHEYDLFNTYFKPDGHRDCRVCIRQRVKSYRQRQQPRAAVIRITDSGLGRAA